MKKLLLALALVGFSASAMAQETEVPVKKYSVATNSFWANWYVQASIASTAAYTSQEECCNKNPFSVDRTTLGFSVAVGKWFTPVIGLRTKFNGAWAKAVNDRFDHHSYEYWNIHEDLVWNWSNCFFGYNEKRVWNLSTFFGLGIIRNMSAGGNNYDLTYNFGVNSAWRVAKHWNVFLEVSTAWFEGTVDAEEGYHDGRNYSKTNCRYWDKLVNCEIGVTYNIGKTGWEKTPDVAALIAMNQEQIDALNRSLKEQEDENARLRELLANQKPSQTKEVVKEVVKKEVVSTAASVFFACGQSKIASRKDLVAVQEIADYVKANGGKVVVTGYADSKTGSAALNQSLSEKRAAAVKAELVKMGVSEDAIVTEAKGGVNTVSPYSYNRRATVKVQ